jgi:hypothetical protein
MRTPSSKTFSNNMKVKRQPQVIRQSPLPTPDDRNRMIQAWHDALFNEEDAYGEKLNFDESKCFVCNIMKPKVSQPVCGKVTKQCSHSFSYCGEFHKSLLLISRLCRRDECLFCLRRYYDGLRQPLGIERLPLTQDNYGDVALKNYVHEAK